MRTTATSHNPPDVDVFSTEEIARAAGVPQSRVAALVATGGIRANDQFVSKQDAIRLVRQLTHRSHDRRTPLTMVAETRRRQGVPLVLSGVLHGTFLLSLVVLTSGLLDATETEQPIHDPQPVRLVYFMAPGPGGGGGGGGLKVPLPPARAERRALKPVRKPSPVPPVRKAPPPPPPAPVEAPKPVEPPKIDPPKVERPKPEPPAAPPQTVQTPVVPQPADPASRPGVLDQPPSAVASAGPGAGGGTGTGAGSGMGEGRGAGIGPGTDGGIGGGPFQPGAGIDPPMLVREVKPLYTEEARRRSIEGDVVLEIVVRRDGSVGTTRLLRKLGAGLDEKALEAVRQWRFSPARRRGAPVDVVVEVSVEFSLR